MRGSEPTSKPTGALRLILAVAIGVAGTSAAQGWVLKVGRWVAMGAGVVFVLLALAEGSAGASGRALRRLMPASVSAFASDGLEYAAWQTGDASPIVVLDTTTMQKTEVVPPAGCFMEGDSVVSTAAAGRFKLNCPTGTDLLIARTGEVVALPAKGPGGVRYSWLKIGTQYVTGHGLRLYDLATGAVFERRRRAEIDPNAPGGSIVAVCRGLRRQVRDHQLTAYSELYGYTTRVLVYESGGHGAVRVGYCNGASKTLKPAKREEAATDVEASGSLLSWNTGLLEGGEGQHRVRGRLYVYDTALGKLEEWRLPVRPGVFGKPPEEFSGTYGYSKVTRTTVFWRNYLGLAGPVRQGRARVWVRARG